MRLKVVVAFALLFGKALALEEEIDQFFNAYNGSDETEIEEPLVGVHFLGSKDRASLQPILHPKSLKISSIESGAGSIDILQGGCPAANSKQMQEALDSIKKGHVYSYLLSQESVSPLVTSAVKQIQTWANQINAININSCEIAATNASSPLMQAQRAEAYLQERALIEASDAEDMIEARSVRLKDPKKAKKALQKIDPTILSDNYNVAWSALSRLGIENSVYKQLFLNITGTIVVKDFKTVELYPPQHRQALAYIQSNKAFEGAYLVEEKDLSVTQGPFPLERLSEKEKIGTLFKEIQQKLIKEEELSHDAATLLEETSFPIGSLITLMTQYKGTGSAIALDRYADLIAHERAMQFVEEAARVMLHAAQSLRGAQIDSYQLDAYIDQVQEVLVDLQALQNQHHQKTMEENLALESMIRLDQELRKGGSGI